MISFTHILEQNSFPDYSLLLSRMSFFVNFQIKWTRAKGMARAKARAGLGLELRVLGSAGAVPTLDKVIPMLSFCLSSVSMPFLSLD